MCSYSSGIFSVRRGSPMTHPAVAIGRAFILGQSPAARSSIRHGLRLVLHVMVLAASFSLSSSGAGSDWCVCFVAPKPTCRSKPSRSRFWSRPALMCGPGGCRRRGNAEAVARAAGCLSGKSKTRSDVSRPLVTHPISRHAVSQIHRSQKAKKTTRTPEATLNQLITESWRSVLFYRQQNPLVPYVSKYSEGI
jgi:hypothetical protein